MVFVYLDLCDLGCLGSPSYLGGLGDLRGLVELDMGLGFLDGFG